MPYLPIDPADIGESYEAVIRVNSQSGKGGIAWVLEQSHGLKLPRKLQVDFSHRVQVLSDQTSRELTTEDIWAAFQKAYYLTGPQAFALMEYESGPVRPGEMRVFAGRILKDRVEAAITGHGNGLISSAMAAMNDQFGLGLEVIDYFDHSLTKGTLAQAVAYIECRTASDKTVFGVGIDTDVSTASIKAVISAANASLSNS